MSEWRSSEDGIYFSLLLFKHCCSCFVLLLKINNSNSKKFKDSRSPSCSTENKKVISDEAPTVFCFCGRDKKTTTAELVSSHTIYWLSVF